jgi:NAD(P)-dependent dehydrogenase (short-subunit alcohol dehydrogenase family)
VDTLFFSLYLALGFPGINYDDHEHAISFDLQDVQTTVETNLYGPWRCSTVMLPLLKQSSYPRIVNVSSGAGSLNGMSGGTPAYGVSKAALNALTLKLARKLPGMKYNAVCPGWIATNVGWAGGGPVGWWSICCLGLYIGKGWAYRRLPISW